MWSENPIGVSAECSRESTPVWHDRVLRTCDVPLRRPIPSNPADPSRRAGSMRNPSSFNKRKRQALFDHLVRAGENGCRHVETELLRGPEVDHQLVLGWRLHWQIGGLLALEDAIDVTGRAPVLVDRIRPVRDEAPTR